MILAHKIQLKPTAEQEVQFRMACGVARYTYNWALAEWSRQYKAGEKPSSYALKKQWNQIKPEWVYESPKDANQAPFAHLQTAFKNFFKKRAEYPKFHTKGKKDSFSINNDQFCVEGYKAILPRIGSVKMTEQLRFQGKIMSGTVSRSANHWFLSINVEMKDYSKPRISDNTEGVDLGVKDPVVLSTGEKFAGPKPLKRLQRKLRRLQKSLSRKQKGSSNRKKAIVKLARLHYRIKNIRNDFLHKITTKLCRENQTIVIEDLNVKGMMANHCLAKAISDIGFGEFRRQIDYKVKIYTDELKVASRWFPSTKTCNRCGLIKDMPLSQRTYICECGYIADRDVNAAKNLRTLGLRGIACGHGSSGSTERLNETTVVEAGILKCAEMHT